MKRALIIGLLVFASGCAMWGDGLGDLNAPNQLQQVRIGVTENAYRFYFTADRPPTYTVFRMVNPIRLVVDVSDLDVRGARKQIQLQQENIEGLRFRQFGSENLRAGRIEISLKNFAEYRSRVIGNTLVLQVDKGVQLADQDGVVRIQALDDGFDDIPDEFAEEDEIGFGDEEFVLEEEIIDDFEDDFAEEEAEISSDIVEDSEEETIEETIEETEEPVEDIEESIEEPVEELAETVEEVEEVEPADDLVEAPEMPLDEVAEVPAAESIEEAPLEDVELAEPVEDIPLDDGAADDAAMVAAEEPMEPIEEAPEAEMLAEPATEEFVETLPEETLEAPLDEPYEDIGAAPVVEEPYAELEEVDPYAEDEVVDPYASEESIEAAPAVEEAMPEVSEEEMLADEALEGAEDIAFDEPAEIEPYVAPAPMPEPVVEEDEIQGMNIVDLQVETGAEETNIYVKLDGPVGDYSDFPLAAPNRIVLDLANYQSLLSADDYPVDAPNITNVRVGRDAEKTRIVIDLVGDEMPAYRVLAEGQTVQIAVATYAESAVEPEPIVEIEPIDIPISEPEDALYAEAEEEAIEGDMALEYSEMAAEIDEPDEDMPVNTSPIVKARTTVIQVDDGQQKKQAAEEEKKVYTGRRMSLDFKDADVDAVLRLIAEVSNLNIITDDDVGGTLSLRLVNVPWDQALDVILQHMGLGMRKMGNILRIAKTERLSEEEKARLQALQDSEQLEPLFIKVIPINYATADEMEDQVDPLLSKRGSVQVDTRTNVLIVKDIQRNLMDVEALISSLDTQTPQVLIEAKIVEANTNFTREMGVQWGGGVAGTNAYGSNTGLFFPNNLNMTGSSVNSQGVAPAAGTPNYAVDLPAAVGTGSGGALGFLFGTLNNNITLSLRLSALESSGEGRVISSPRITTMDNREAIIKQGISIPFETVSAEGTQTQFIDATIEMKVTPHVNSDRSIALDIEARKNAPVTELRSASGAPSISKKEAKTQVLVYDGETTVIGGIFQIEKAKSSSGIPWLSKIPILGYFFRKKSESETRNELLIFITPRIVTRTANAAGM